MRKKTHLLFNLTSSYLKKLFLQNGEDAKNFSKLS